MLRHGRPRLVVYNPDPEPTVSSPSVWDRVPPPPPLDIKSPPNHSNPTLSSPSSTSSRAIESTPPPSTPGLSNQIVDLGSDSPSSPDTQPAPQSIENVHHPKRTLRTFFGMGHHSSSSNVPKERPKQPRRPQTSPTVSTSSDHHHHVHYPPAGTGERILIGVTTDWERFMPVDISGATCADFIKERILSKLQVSDDDQSVSTFTFHKTDFSGQSTGDALTDDQLVQLCREEGDAFGRLHLLVRVAQTRVAEPHKLFNALSPSSNTLVPPPFPVPFSRPPPIQPSSRQDSISSASESHPEPNGYEGDVDGEQQPPTTRRGVRPLPQPHQPASPRDGHRPLPPSSPKVYTRPLSPPVLPVQEPSRHAAPSDSKYGSSGYTSAGVPPLSPSRSTFPLNEEQSTHLNLPQIRHLHIRSGSDATAEREAVQQQQQQSTESSGPIWNTPPAPLRTPGMHKGRTRRGISENDEVRPEARYTDKDRQGSQDITRSPQFVQRTNHISSSPVRPKNTSPSIRGLSIPNYPTNPPPAVPGVSHETRPPARVPNQQVPSNWAVMWKSVDNKTKNAPVTPTPRGDRHMLNRYKSEDSLRALARGNVSSHPVNLQPGRHTANYRSGNPNSSESLRGAVNGLPRSYESRRQLPMHGPVYGEHRQQSTGTSTLLSPSSQDLYARPNSSLGDNDTTLAGSSQRVMSNIRSPTHVYNSTTFSPTTTIDTCGERLGSPHSPPRPTIELKSDSSGSSTYTPVSGLFSEASRWTSDESSTIIAPKSVAPAPPRDEFSGTNLTSPTATFMSSESDTDLWNVRPQEDTIILTPTKPKLEVKTSSYNTSMETKQTSYMSSKSSPHGSGSPRASKALQGTFAENSWAPRPPAEVVYDRLEEFFSGHDLDRPVVESSSGGTSPTNPEPASVPAPLPERDLARARGKKSIRVVAKEHQRRVRDSRADTSAIAMHRKRSTKLWGSKVEEITPSQARAALSVPDDSSASNGAAPTFKWVRGELIGKGTYGRVYLALNATTGEMIAVKQVELVSGHNGGNDSKQEAVVQALKMESETLKDLDHPNIVSYLGFEETPQTLSIFLEYVPGGSISSCLHKHGKFDEEVTKSFTAQILLGLEYLHSKRIIHRDLKADNILVETSGICKISDFGISKRTTDLQANTSLQGTVFWMAPEVVDTRLGSYNSKVDIWSVGCVVLEMWGGRRPWNGEASWAVMFKLYNERQAPPVPEDVTLSPLADEFRLKCFAVNPDDRPTATELKQHPYLTLAPGWIFTGFK